MRIRFTFPMGSEGWADDVDGEAVPRVGEIVDREDTEYEVRTVVHYPFDDPPLVYVVLKRPG